MIQHMTFLYRFQLGVAQAMVADLSPQQMVGQPHGVVNHPAWSLGHLVMTADRLGQLLGLDAAAPAEPRQAASPIAVSVTTMPLQSRYSSLSWLRSSSRNGPDFASHCITARPSSRPKRATAARSGIPRTATASTMRR